MKLFGPIITCLALTIPAARGQTGEDRCPYARGVQEPLPGWAPRSDMPLAACRSNLTRSYQRESTFTRVLFRQDDSLPPNPAAAGAIDEAVGAALDLFGSHAGNASLPLVIHLTLTDTSALPPAAFKTTPSIAAGRPLVLFDSFGAPGPHTASPCFLLAGSPRAGDERAPLLRLKKDVVRAMYHCVQQFLHDEVVAPARAAPWWRLSLARFLDGIAFSATAELVAKPTLLWANHNTAFPEHFSPLQWAVKTGDGAAFSLFWHWLYLSHKEEWTLARIADWLRRYPRVIDYQLHMTHLALDPDMPALFRAFGRAYLLGELYNLTYPDGKPIRLFRPEMSASQLEMARPFLDDSGGGVRLAPGEERLADRPRRPETAKLRARNWAMDLWNVTLAGGQTVDVTIRPTAVVDWWGISWLERHVWSDFSKDVHWSYRRAGEATLTSVAPGETARIVVPADVSGGAVYEFVATCTGYYYEMVDIEFKLRGVVQV